MRRGMDVVIAEVLTVVMVVVLAATSYYFFRQTIGGTIGVLLGIISVDLFEYSIRSLFKFAFPLTGISFSTFLDIIFIIFGLGIFSSLLPAYIASNLKVAEALRWE